MAATLERATPTIGNVSRMTPVASHDRTTQDVDSRIAKEFGNIVAIDHANMVIPDQRLATAFYVVGLGFTRDPYKRVALDNMGINIGRSQLHLNSSGRPRLGKVWTEQRLRGTIGVVVPDLGELEKRLEKVVPVLGATQFTYKVHADRIETTCPWGNRYRCHAPSVEFGDIDLGIAYVEFDVPRGTAAGIARFYREGLRAHAAVEQRGGDAVACVRVGIAQQLLFHETDAPIPPYDGHHIAIYVADYSNPHHFLSERGLVTDAGEQWGFSDIVDLDSGKVLFTVEHEMKSLKNPLYGKPLVNRNPVQTNNNRERSDEFQGRV